MRDLSKPNFPVVGNPLSPVETILKGNTMRVLNMQEVDQIEGQGDIQEGAMVLGFMAGGAAGALVGYFAGGILENYV